MTLAGRPASPFLAQARWRRAIADASRIEEVSRLFAKHGELPRAGFCGCCIQRATRQSGIPEKHRQESEYGETVEPARVSVVTRPLQTVQTKSGARLRAAGQRAVSAKRGARARRVFKHRVELETAAPHAVWRSRLSPTWPPPWIRKPPARRSLEGRRKLDSAQAVSRFARRPRDAGTPPPCPIHTPHRPPLAGASCRTSSVDDLRYTGLRARRRTPAGRTRRTRLMGARRIWCAHHASHACTAASHACPERLQHR